MGPSCATVSESNGISEDTLLGGRVRLRQPVRGHRAGTDAVLLAALCGAKPGDRVADLGSASGAVGLMVAARCPTIELVMVDLDPDLVALAGENALLNAVSASTLTLNLLGDVKAWPDLGPARGGCDLVVTNPPYFERQPKPSPDPNRRRAHLMEGGSLEIWLSSARRFLKPGGRIAMIGRADRLTENLAAARVYFRSLNVTPIYPQASGDATRIIITGKSDSRAADVLRPPIILHDATGRFTSVAQELHMS